MNEVLIWASQAEAKKKLLEMLRDRLKPNQAPDFPGDDQAQQESEKETQYHPIAFPSEATRPTATSRVTAIKMRNLERQMQALEEDYTAAFEQHQFTSNAADLKRLERQIQSIEHELTKAAEQLNALGK